MPDKTVERKQARKYAVKAAEDAVVSKARVNAAIERLEQINRRARAADGVLDDLPATATAKMDELIPIIKGLVNAVDDMSTILKHMVERERR